VEVTLVVTLGLLLALLNLSYYVWDPTLGRPLPRFFDGSKVRLLDVNISYHQLIVLAVGCVVAIGLRLLLGRTRVGLAMRAVVDDSDLLAMNAGDPERVTAFSWALGAALAALAGVLIAPLVTLDALSLTLLVVNAYAAAVIGRLRSLPLTFAGGLGLGLVVTYATGYFPQTESWDRLAAGVPTIALFIVLIFLPPAGVARAQASSRRVPGLPSTVAVTASAIAFAAATVVVARGATLSHAPCRRAAGAGSGAGTVGRSRRLQRLARLGRYVTPIAGPSQLTTARPERWAFLRGHVASFDAARTNRSTTRSACAVTNSGVNGSTPVRRWHSGAITNAVAPAPISR
jgi:hypothetical protein